MKIFEVQGPGSYLGTITIVVAEDETQALALAKAALAPHGIHEKDLAQTKVMRELLTDKPMCYVLHDGDY